MDSHETYDVIVVGGGPAGLSAALVLGRCRRRVLVLDDGGPRNAAAAAVRGYLGRDGTPPLELLRLAREEVAGYGVEVRHERAVSACTVEPGSGRRTGGGAGERGAADEAPGRAPERGAPRHRRGSTLFEVTGSGGDVYRCRKLLLATGVRDELPEVDGMRTYYGRGVHHCPYCDGWEVRDRRLAVLGSGSDGTGLALGLLAWSPSVTFLAHGAPLDADVREKLETHGVAVVEEEVLRLEGGSGAEGRLEAVRFAGGGTLAIDALFFHTHRVQHSELPALLGCEVEPSGDVRVRGAQRTGVPGLFLAGDADGDVQFAIVAAAEGARAAVAIHQELHREGLA